MTNHTAERIERVRPESAVTTSPGSPASTRTRASRARRLAVAWLLALVGGLAALLATPPAAYAQADDQIDSFKIDYQVDESGVLQVEETIVWRFGDDSGRHGIRRELITREPDADNPDKDIVYEISNFRAT